MRAPPILAIALALSLAPALALAQGIAGAPDVGTGTVRLDVANIHTLPPGSPKTANVTVTFCAPSGGVVGGAHRVHVGVEEAPAWLDVQFEPDVFTFAVVLPGDCDVARGVVRFNASTDAPAYETQRVVLAAEAERDAGVSEATEYFFRVGYYGDLDVTPSTARLTVPAGEPTSHEVSVTNHGNAETTFRLNLAGGRDDVQVAIPQPLVLAPGESGTWDVTVVAPAGTGFDPRTVELLVTSHARMDHEAPGKSAIVRVTLDPEPSAASATSGFGVPALPLAASVVAVLAAAAIVRHARRKR